MEIPLLEKGKQYIKALTKRLESPKSIGDRDLLDFIKALPLSFCLALIWFLFENEFIRLINKHILPLSLKMNFSFITHFLFGIITILIIWCIHKCYKKKYFVPWNIILPSLFGIVVYIIYRITYYGSLPWGIVGYSDILVLLFGIFLINSIRVRFPKKEEKKESNQTKNKSGFIFLPDTALENPKDDELDYSRIAKELAKNIEDIKKESSFSIGLVAPWGYGKTTFLNFLQRELDENGDFIIIDFNPRHSYNASNIQEDFFNTLFSELKKFDFRFSSSFKNYLKAIDVINENKLITFLFNTHKIWDKKIEKEKINTAISRISKRIIVIIEDFDRLLHEEIIEVLKLIDGNASFTNLIFLTAYDRNYINNILNEKCSSNTPYFIDKFFDFELPLPLRPYENIFTYLINELAKDLNANSEEKEVYRSTLIFHMDSLQPYLSTMRDVKRFLNLLLCQYDHIKRSVEFKDYFFLHLIKYKHPEEYLDLFDKKYLSEKEGRLTFNETTNNVHSLEIIKILVPKNSNYTDISINNTLAFKEYFYGTIYNHLSIQTMDEMFSFGFDEVKLYIEKAISNNTIKKVIEFLDAQNVLLFKVKNQFERYLDIFIYLNNKKEIDNTVPYLKIFTFLYVNVRKQIKEKYQYSDENYKALISKKIQGEYPDYPCNLTAAIIVGIFDNDFKEEIIFSKEEVLSIAQKALDDLIEHENKYSNLHLQLLSSCIDSLDQETRKISLNQDACKKIKRLIEANPYGYLKDYVQAKSPKFINCEPYWEQIFENAGNFQEFITTQQKKDVPNIELVKNFWKLYKNNNFNPIEFRHQENVQEKIDNNLDEEAKQLDELLNIEKEYNSYNEKQEKTPTNTHRQFLSPYRDLLSRIDKNRLYITLRQKIKDKIEESIKDINYIIFKQSKH